MPVPLFLLSGLGGDGRVFDGQRAVRDVRPVDWILPADPDETLAEYAARLAGMIPVNSAFDLGGASFGGMVALELVRHLSPRRVFLFGSCRTPDAIARPFRVLSALASRLPDGLVHPPPALTRLAARWFGAESRPHADLVAAMVAATPPAFLRWAPDAIFSWAGVGEPGVPVHHVHGGRDRMIPVRRVMPDRVIAEAGHLLTLTHASAVNEFLSSVDDW